MNGLKCLAKRLKKGDGERKKGQGRKRSARTAEPVGGISAFAGKNPTSGQSSIKKLQSKFKVTRGALHRVLKEDLKFKSVRRVKVTRLSAKHKEARVKFAQDYLSAVDNGALGADAVFWSDETHFVAGKGVSNPNNDRVRVPAGVKKATSTLPRF